MPPDNHDLDDLGFGEAELRETLDSNLGVGIGDKLDLPQRFLLSVARLLKSRLVEDAASESAPSIFFLLGDNEFPPGLDRHEPLLHNGAVAVESTLWFVGANATGARGLRVHPWVDGDAFDLAIDGLGVGSWPAVVFDPTPARATARFYPNGIIDGASSMEIELEVVSIDLGDVFEEIDRAHLRHLASPSTRPNLWAVRTKHYARSNAEDLIQTALEIALQARYLTCDVRAEQPGPSGRLDLEIYVPLRHPNGPKAPGALLELKVLRSFGEKGSTYSTEETQAQIKDGVVQASSYRDDRHFPSAGLCCFDMRANYEGDACFAHVLATAHRRSIVLRVWPIFNRTPAFRAWRDAKIYGTP